jgi:hypothetical protein
MAGTFTYTDQAVRESLLDVITNISPEIDPLYTGLQKSSADQPYHQWLTDTLAPVGTNAQGEGADPSYADRTNPARKTNYTQIVRKDVLVSGSDRASNTAGFQDRFQYEVKKAMKEWRRDAELAILRGSLASGGASTGQARQMAGIKAQITTLATAPSGVSLSETMLNNYLQNAWNQGGDVDLILVGGTLKRRIDGFSANNTRYVQAEDKKIVNTISTYVSSFGVHELQLHRLVDLSADVNSQIFGLQKDKWAVSHLRGREPELVKVAPTGDATKAYVIGELTTEGRAENSSFYSEKLL